MRNFLGVSYTCVYIYIYIYIIHIFFRYMLSEAERAANFEELRSAKQSEIASGEKMAETKEDEKATTDNNLAEAKEDKEETEKAEVAGL